MDSGFHSKLVDNEEKSCGDDNEDNDEYNDDDESEFDEWDSVEFKKWNSEKFKFTDTNFFNLEQKTEINYRMGRIRIHFNNKMLCEYECLICSKIFKKFVEFSDPDHTEDDKHIESSTIDMDIPEIDENCTQFCGEIYASEYPRKYSLICFLCQEEITIYNEIIEHMDKKHTDLEKNLEMKYYKCNQCDEAFTDIENLENHVKIHPQKKSFKCIHCKAPTFFGTPSHWFKHEQIHLQKIVKNKCRICGKLNRNSNALKNHIEVAHQGKRDYKCETCGKKYAYSHSLRYHMKNHTGDLKFQCSSCGRRFKDSTVLRIHMRTHSKERPYKCECGKSFGASSTLLCHKKAFHLPADIGKRYKCIECEKQFVTKYELKLHEELKHPKHAETHKCEVCGKEYSHKLKLKIHKVIHQNTGKFPCPVCGKAFEAGHRLNQHLKRVCTKNKFTCELCGFAAKYKISLQKHLNKCDGSGTTNHRRNKNTEKKLIKKKLNKPKQCPTCGKVVTILRSHMLTHSDERTKMCSLCNKTYKDNAALKRHLKQHNNDSYPCNECPKTYTTNASLRYHIKLKH